jgi:hypothetical protein
VIHVKLTPSRNEMRFEHIGCDTPTPWIVPLDDCMAPAVGEIEECARCCLLVRIGKVELTEDFDWGGVGVQPAHKAQRGSNVETYIKRMRNILRNSDGTDNLRSQAADWILDDYRLHADTGTPLDQEASDGGDPENSGAYV